MFPFRRKSRLAGATGIELRQTKQDGRKIFATRRIRRGEVIEAAPLLRIDAAQTDALMATALYSRYFLASGSGDIAIGLGYTSLYQHAASANAACEISLARQRIIVRAHRDIAPATQITINYNGSPEDDSPVAPTAHEPFGAHEQSPQPFTRPLEQSHLYIADTPKKGRGVFAARGIGMGELIEACPYFTLSGKDYECLAATSLSDYCFELDKEAGQCALVLGFGSLYNHARHANAGYYLDVDSRSMLYYAETEIHPGQEICINYEGRPGETTNGWFESRNLICE